MLCGVCLGQKFIFDFADSDSYAIRNNKLYDTPCKGCSAMKATEKWK